MSTLTALLAGFGLDLLLGDPRWLPHPVVAMGRAIGGGERWLRKHFPVTPRGELAAGCCLALGLPLLAGGLGWGLLYLAGLVHPGLRWALECYLCYQLLATRELWRQSMAVAQALQAGDLPAARQALRWIVGRDTERLDQSGVTKAAIETVAENASDGVVAPLLFLLLGGAPAGLAYKAINTMDSMIGYRNERYLYFGRAAAKLDDLVNYLPARFCALCMVAVAPLLGVSAGGAWRIWRRDGRKHASPNSAQTEAACAGALGLELAGDAWYGGQRLVKPTIGEARRPPEIQDIWRANRLMLAASLLALLLGGLLRWLLIR